MSDSLKLALAGVVLLAAVWWKNRQYIQVEVAAEGLDMSDAWAEIENNIYESTGLDMGGGGFISALNSRGEAYKQTFSKAEAENGIPPLMLARLAYQESRFRADIISGQTVSSAGALGIMQIVPRWHPDVNPLDPVAAIHYAGKYLRQLYNQFGTWERALQAYNWGPGNLANYLSGNISTMPTETANYSRQILAEIGSEYA